MIITPDIKTLTGPQGQFPNDSRSNPPPPSYGTAQHYDPRVIVQPYTGPILVREYGVVAYRQSPGQRFLRAFFVAIIVWFLLAALVQSFVEAIKWAHKGWPWVSLLHDLWTGGAEVVDSRLTTVGTMTSLLVSLLEIVSRVRAGRIDQSLGPQKATP